jgi:uncharacterized membrane protein YkoI
MNMKKYAIALIAASGLLVACNQSLENASQSFNELPPAVQKTVRAQAPDAEIANISKTTRNGMDAYEVKLNQNGQNPKLVVAADGTLLSTDFPRRASAIEKMLTPTGAVGTQFSALPEAAQKAITAHAPNAQIANVTRHDENGRVIYEVEFKDQGKNPTMKVADDGTLVQGLQK